LWERTRTVWLVELAPLSEEGLVSRAFAEAVGVAEQPDRPIADALCAFLRDREMLLVTDNCEHLVEPAAWLVNVLLDSCPRLRILATSRELLGIAGELNWPVPVLSVPDERAFTVDAVEGHEATRLFASRASYRRPDFSVTPDNARAVATICRRLDGIPLAIELAAARVGSLSARQIAHRLDSSLDLLAGGRTVVARHRTLEAALDWSHELLGEQEQEFSAGLRCSWVDGRWRQRRRYRDLGREFLSSSPGSWISHCAWQRCPRAAGSDTGCWSRSGSTRWRSWGRP
jgi:predicted ATPase